MEEKKTATQLISEIYQKQAISKYEGKKALIFANSNVMLGEGDNLSDYDSDGVLRPGRALPRREWHGP